MRNVWNRDRFLDVVPDMLEKYKKNCTGSPGILGENYQNEEGFLVNDTCHGEWDRILDEMISLFREADERQCRRKNPYENENMESIKRQYRKVSITDDFAALSESGFTVQTPPDTA